MFVRHKEVWSDGLSDHRIRREPKDQYYMFGNHDFRSILCMF